MNKKCTFIHFSDLHRQEKPCAPRMYKKMHIAEIVTKLESLPTKGSFFVRSGEDFVLTNTFL